MTQATHHCTRARAAASSGRALGRRRSAISHTTDRPAGRAAYAPARRARTRRRRLRPALGWPGREPAPAPGALARMLAAASGLGREPGPAKGPERELGSERELGPARRRVAAGGGASARLLRAAAVAGAQRRARGGASASARGASDPVSPRAVPRGAPERNASAVHARVVAPPRWNRSQGRPCWPRARACAPSRVSFV
jgi:hypothetical protein